MIQRRTPEARAAYIEGLETGVDLVLKELEGPAFLGPLKNQLALTINLIKPKIEGS